MRGRCRVDFTVDVNWEGCWHSKNPAKEGEDELVLSGSGNKAEKGSHNPHMRFINAAAVASLTVDLVVPLKYFGLSQSDWPPSLFLSPPRSFGLLKLPHHPNLPSGPFSSCGKSSDHMTT